MNTDVVSLTAAVLVALALAWAGVAKARDRAGLTRTLRFVPVDEDARSSLATGIPFAELVIAVALLAPWTRAAAIVLATALLSAFTAFIVITKGLDADGGCRCFGSRPTTRRNAVLRNAVLVLLLLVAAFGTGTVALLMALLMIPLAGLGYWRLFPPADEAPPEPRSWNSGTPRMLVFTEPGCVSCADLLARIPGWSGGPPVEIVDDPAVLDAQGITRTPSAVVLDDHGARVDGNGRPDLEPVVGPDAIERRYAVAVRGHDLPIPDGAAEAVLLFLGRDDEVPGITTDVPVVVLATGRVRTPPAGATLTVDAGHRLAELFDVTLTPAAVRVGADGRPRSAVRTDPGGIATLLQRSGS